MNACVSILMQVRDFSHSRDMAAGDSVCSRSAVLNVKLQQYGLSSVLLACRE